MGLHMGFTGKKAVGAMAVIRPEGHRHGVPQSKEGLLRQVRWDADRAERCGRTGISGYQCVPSRNGLFGLRKRNTMVLFQ